MTHPAPSDLRRQPLPLIILAGSDREPGAMPEGAAGAHPLTGVKGIDLRIDGRPLIELVVERFAAVGAFDPIYLAGPEALYAPVRGPAQVIDTDGTFGENLRAAVETVAARHPGSAVALAACDVVPKAEEVERLLADYHRHAPLDFWFPLIRVPKDQRQLGASAWKPRYRIASPEGQRASLPGHLVIVDPAAFRLPLVYRCFELAYRTRNRPLGRRFWTILGHLILGLVAHDLRRLLRLRPPTFTASLLWNGTLFAYHLGRGVISEEELGERLRRFFIRSAHRKRYPERRGRVHVMEALSLAKDIDTREEADELLRELAAGGDGGKARR